MHECIQILLENADLGYELWNRYKLLCVDDWDGWSTSLTWFFIIGTYLHDGENCRWFQSREIQIVLRDVWAAIGLWTCLDWGVVYLKLSDMAWITVGMRKKTF